MKKSKFFVLITICLFVMGMFGAMSAQAAAAPFVSKEVLLKYETAPEAPNSVGLVIQNCPSKAVVKNLKSSNKKVITVDWNSKSRDMIGVSYHKLGKATISFDLVWGSKKKHFTIKAVVVKYECPVASFKLGSKNYGSTFKNKRQTYVSMNKKYQYKVSVTPKKGWKLAWIEFSNGKTLKNIKNNSTIKCGKVWNYVNVFFENKKTGEMTSTIIYLEP